MLTQGLKKNNETFIYSFYLILSAPPNTNNSESISHI